jgi:hypothetical protein
MSDGFGWSIITAAGAVAVVHTLLGPDHYLPFVMLSRARGWSRRRTATVTAICGGGHVAASLLVGALGLLLGATVGRLDRLEATRGDWAAWLLIAFGLAYGIWGARKALRTSKGIEPHDHGGHVHVHTHGDLPHGHAARDPAGASFWALFAIFVLGPCEPLIPLFVLPASRGRFGLALSGAAVFGVVTVGLMVGLVLAARFGVERLRLAPLERWSHTLAGAVIAASGLAVVALGL